MLISFLLFFYNLAGSIVAANSRISTITNLFTGTLKKDFFVVAAQSFSLFPHFLERA
jgi:hypothetical protein